jgi:GTPase SAR1 family protein
MGLNVETLEYAHAKFTVWDLGGNERLVDLWKHYYFDTAALVYVVDSSDIERMETAREDLHRILSE